MLNLNLTSEIKELKDNLDKFQKRKLPNATKIAINETLELVKKGEQLEMKRKFQGGATGWTLRSLRIFKAGTKAGVTKGRIFILKLQEQYLQYMIDGGVSMSNKGRWAVPIDKSRTNKFGNLPRGKSRGVKTKNEFYATINGTAGIWARDRTGNIKLKVVFSKIRKYTNKLFDFYGVGTRIIRVHFNKRLRIGITKTANKI